MVEDVWADLRTQEEIKKLDYYRLTLSQIEDLKLVDIPEGMADDENIVSPRYVRENVSGSPLPVVLWSKKELTSIRKRFEPILANTNVWQQGKQIQLKDFVTGSEEDTLE